MCWPSVSVGIHLGLAPGALAIPDQLFDYTWGRKQFLKGRSRQWCIVDFTQPYCHIAQCLLDGAQHAGVEALDGGTYACTQGPRLETAAEIARLRHDGADMVGMTGMPEAAWRASWTWSTPVWRWWPPCLAVATASARWISPPPVR